MHRILAVVANEPLAYREALAATLRQVRPGIDTAVVAPAELDEATTRHTPHFVVCSRLTDVVEGTSLAWVLLYPHGEPWCELSLAGERTRVAHIDLSLILALLDRTVVHAEAEWRAS